MQNHSRFVSTALKKPTCGAGVDHSGFGQLVLEFQHRQTGLGGLGGADGADVLRFVTFVKHDLRSRFGQREISRPLLKDYFQLLLIHILLKIIE